VSRLQPQHKGESNQIKPKIKTLMIEGGMIVDGFAGISIILAFNIREPSEGGEKFPATGLEAI